MNIHLLINKIERNPDKNAPILIVEMATETNKMVHAKNAGRILRRNGYNGRTARRKAFNFMDKSTKTCKLCFKVTKVR